MLCMTEKLLNSSVKQPLGASPNTLLFGNAIIHHTESGHDKGILRRHNAFEALLLAFCPAVFFLKAGDAIPTYQLEFDCLNIKRYDN